jgi:hypothetical protein
MANFLESIDVKTPCSESWDEMFGDDKVRFCSHCAKSVHNLSGMRPTEINKLVAQSNGNLCVRYIKKPDGKMVTIADKLHQIVRRTGVAAGTLAAGLSLSAMVYAQGEAMVKKPNQTQNDGKSNKQKPKQRTTTADISFVIYDAMNAVVPNAKVTLVNQTTRKNYTVLSNDEGVAVFDMIENGEYEVSAVAPGFRTYKQMIVFKSEDHPSLKITLDLGAIMGDIVTISYETPLHLAVAQDDLEQVKRLISSGSNVNSSDKSYDNRTPLHIAIENGNLEMVRILIESGADVNAKTKLGITPLLMIEDHENGFDLAKLLVSKGADVNVQNNGKETVLMFAAEGGNVEFVRLLLENGANPRLKDRDGETALEKTNVKEIKDILIGYGAIPRY